MIEDEEEARMLRRVMFAATLIAAAIIGVATVIVITSNADALQKALGLFGAVLLAVFLHRFGQWGTD